MSPDAMPLEKLRRRGLMLVLSSPSGAGKTTITRRILEQEPDMEISVSVTTRPQRPGEEEGVHYFFIDQDRFDDMVEQEELLEYARVFGKSYGTPRAPVDKVLSAGRDVVCDVDWQGTQQLKQRIRDDLVSIFILPPSTDELERRLHTRAQDSEEVIRSRMAKAADEISHWPEYDYVVINDDLDRATREVKAILVAERLKRERQVDLPAFVRSLTDAG
ncbi:MAG: guanylate kinase [Alphaproteobacteria bacterium]|nr:guanylate kinase [Alphaproteobacteria bacterium]